MKLKYLIEVAHGLLQPGAPKNRHPNWQVSDIVPDCRRVIRKSLHGIAGSQKICDKIDA
jgi:hypothetical protein